ncbi:MAG TPA: hypothetical protein VFT32_01140 [Candidatus Eisenbacteria bacterium]|nr:hypothetical protein [Candidatus Eisenbacteria bacterium]
MRTLVHRFLALALAALAISHPRTGAHAQEYDDYSAFVPDSLFESGPRTPVSYMSLYNRDQTRGTWTQSLGFSRSFRTFAVNLSGGTTTAEDLVGSASQSTTGDLGGQIDWRATDRLFFSLIGAASMSSISDGVRSSNSEQRRNRLGLQAQYRVEPIAGAKMTLLASSEIQRNHDLRNTARPVGGATGAPDSMSVQRDSAYFSGRLDTVRGRLDWTLAEWLLLNGTATGSWTKPTTDVRTLRATTPNDGSPGLGSDLSRRERLPADNAGFEGKLSVTRLHATRLELFSRVRGSDQVYFDLGQLQVEQFSNDTRTHSASIETSVLPKTLLSVNASVNRAERQYQARPNLNALVTTRELKSLAAYNTPTTTVFASFTVNRSRAEQQATGNGIVLTRSLNTNLSHRMFGRIYLTALGSATLNSYRYLAAQDDRDIASAFGSAGLRFALTPRCSTSANFAVSRTHNVSIDETRSSGNLAQTIYQLNGALRMPLSHTLSVWQDYVLSATYRKFDYTEELDDLSRNFRIDTIVADTLFPFAYLRLDHRYNFFDRGDFTPLQEGGPRLYGVQQKQYQQTLEGTIGVRPVAGIIFVVKQSLADTDSRNIVGNTAIGTKQWNLSLGVEVNRSFWSGAGLTGAIRRESKYQNVSAGGPSINEEEHWLAAVQFQKDF